jgi:hypothetical protein
MSRSSPLTLIPLFGTAVFLAPAWAATGTLTANPNPCSAPAGETYASYISWTTQGVIQGARLCEGYD